MFRDQEDAIDATLLHLVSRLVEGGALHAYGSLLEGVELADEAARGGCVVEIDDGHGQVGGQAAAHERGEEKETADGGHDHAKEVDRVGHQAAQLPSGDAQDGVYAFAKGHRLLGRLMMTDMPGRRSATGDVGRARTSKVFESYWPVVFVAFHAA